MASQSKSLAGAGPMGGAGRPKGEREGPESREEAEIVQNQRTAWSLELTGAPEEGADSAQTHPRINNRVNRAARKDKKTRGGVGGRPPLSKVNTKCPLPTFGSGPDVNPGSVFQPGFNSIANGRFC